MTNQISTGDFIVSGDGTTGKLHLEGQEEVKEFSDKYDARQHVAELYNDDKISTGLYDKLAAQIDASSLPDSQDLRRTTPSVSKGSVADHITPDVAAKILENLGDTPHGDERRH